jgi:HEAT repeat protein
MCTEKNPDANWLLSHMTLDALPEIALLRLTGDWGRKAEGGRLLLVAPEKVATDRIATLALLAEGCDLKYFEVFNFLGGYLTINGKTLPKVYDGPYDGPAGVPFGCVWCMPLWVRLDGPGPWKVQYHAADGLESNTLTLAAPAAVNAASAPAPSASSGQAARAGQTRPPEQKGRERAAADIKAGTPRILYYGKPWSLGKPLVDEASRLPVELVAGCDVMPEFVAETDAYNAAMRQWAKSRPAGAAPAAPSGASTRPGAATQTAQAAGAGTPAHGEEIVIPLDFQREAVLLPRPAALAAMHWDVAKLEDNCRAELAAQGKKGADPNRVAFGISYTNQASAVPLSGLAEVRVRPITFVAQEELKDLAARLTGKDRRAAEASLPELYRLGGRARNIVPMLLPHIKAGKSYSEVLTVVHGLGVLGPHAAEAVPALAEKFRAAEDLDKSWYALALGRVGAPAVATLERLLRQDSDEIARRAAARGLARGDPAGRRALHAALSDPSADVRAAAVAELPDDSDRETRDLVVRLLGDPSAGVRQAAAGKASLCEPALKGQAVAALLGMLSEADERSQICALYGLGALGSRPEIVVPRLKPFLQSRGEASGQTRGAALSAVARFGPAAADLAPDVIACLDGDKTQTVAALRALEAIGGKPAGAAATRVVALAASKNWGIADAATSTLFTVESDSPAHAARVVSLLSDQHVDTRQRLAGQALAAMGPAAKDALPVLASGLVSIGSIGFVPAEKVRWMAAIDAEGAVAAIENDQRAQPRRGDGFRVQDQRGGSLIILQRLKAHAAAVAEQAQDKGQRRPTREFEYLPSRDWPRVVRAGDRIERVIALLGTPDSVGGGMLTYDALPGKDPSCRPRKIVVSVEHGKATAVREEAPIAAKMVPAGEEGRPGSNARELLSGATTQPASQPASPL